MSSDIEDWNITFVDTGRHASVGERLWAVREHIDGEGVFLANYADGLSNLNLSACVDTALSTGKTASFIPVHPAQTFHVVGFEPSGMSRRCQPSPKPRHLQGLHGARRPLLDGQRFMGDLAQRDCLPRTAPEGPVEFLRSHGASRGRPSQRDAQCSAAWRSPRRHRTGLRSHDPDAGAAPSRRADPVDRPKRYVAARHRGESQRERFPGRRLRCGRGRARLSRQLLPQVRICNSRTPSRRSSRTSIPTSCLPTDERISIRTTYWWRN